MDEKTIKSNIRKKTIFDEIEKIPDLVSPCHKSPVIRESDLVWRCSKCKKDISVLVLASYIMAFEIRKPK